MNDGFKANDFTRELVDTVDGFIDNSEFGDSVELKENNSRLVRNADSVIDYIQIKGENTSIVVDSKSKYVVDVKIDFIKDNLNVSKQDVKDLLETITDLPSLKSIHNIQINKVSEASITDDITDFISKKPLVPPKMPTTRQPLSNK